MTFALRRVAAMSTRRAIPRRLVEFGHRQLVVDRRVPAIPRANPHYPVGHLSLARATNGMRALNLAVGGSAVRAGSAFNPVMEANMMKTRLLAAAFVTGSIVAALAQTGQSAPPGTTGTGVTANVSPETHCIDPATGAPRLRTGSGSTFFSPADVGNTGLSRSSGPTSGGAGMTVTSPGAPGSAGVGTVATGMGTPGSAGTGATATVHVAPDAAGASSVSRTPASTAATVNLNPC